MAYLFKFIKKLRGLHRLSKIALELGFTLMSLFYITAAIAVTFAPYANDYLYALSVYRGALEAAPASLAAGACAAFIGDLMLRGRASGSDMH